MLELTTLTAHGLWPGLSLIGIDSGKALGWVAIPPPGIFFAELEQGNHSSRR